MTYHSSSLVVMQIHLLPETPAPLPRVHELPAELEAEPDVVRTPSPLPVPNTPGHGVVSRNPGPALVVTVVAIARLNCALTAGPGHRVRHCRTGDGVDESRLTTP